jgi:hypothetical protein
VSEAVSVQDLSCFVMKGCVWRERGWWRLIWSAVSLLKSGGLVWASLVACETERGNGAAMHGCLILVPARAATTAYFPRDLRTIDPRAIQHLTIVALNLVSAATNTPSWRSTRRNYNTPLASAKATSALPTIYHSQTPETPRAINYPTWPQQPRSAQTSTGRQSKTTLTSLAV